MAQQQIITKPYVEELQDNDSLFINHDGALRQIKKSSADFASGADMRAEVAAREAFEAQEVAAREAFEKSETEARVQFETSVGEQIAEKANVDGYYEEMTVGDAEQLISSLYAENSEPYGYRTTGGSADVGNRAYLDKIVGGTVAWNQLYGDYVLTGETINGVTFTPQSDGTIIVNGTPDGMDDIYYRITGEFSFGDHVVLLRGCPSGGSIPTYSVYLDSNGQVVDVGNGVIAKQVAKGKRFYIRIRKETTTTFNNVKFKPQIFDLTQMFGSTIANYIYSLEQSQAGAGVAWFKKLFPKDYYPYNAGELLSVEGLQSHDTVGFNQWDEEWEIGTILPSTGKPASTPNKIRSKNPIPILPNTDYHIHAGSVTADSDYVYFYDANKAYIGSQTTSHGTVLDWTFTTPNNARYMKFIVYNTTYNHDICINLSDPTRNGEYEPYEKHSYPLDSSLTLRGIPKLDASNNIYYDGDEYTSDGKVKRKYGVYTIQASNVSLNNNAYTNISYAEIVSLPNMLRSMYKQCVHSKFGVGKYGYPFDDASHVGELLVNSAANRFWFGFAKGTTEEQMKSALDGTTIVYELATPATETAEPFQHIQIVDDFGTEEFVSTGIVPVGHNTRYPANLRDKLQHLPSLASADGTYLIQQSGKQMSLIHMPAVFPETPTEDGTYTLKTVVTGGVATLQWVVE